MTHEITVKVRFSETDALGHVSNISYFIYLEEARIEFLKKMGLGMSNDKWSIIMLSVNCTFLKQAYFDQKLKVASYVTKIGNSSFKLGHRITDAESGQLIAEGDAGAVYFDFQAQKSMQLPERVRQKLEEYMIEG